METSLVAGLYHQITLRWLSSKSKYLFCYVIIYIDHFRKRKRLRTKITSCFGFQHYTNAWTEYNQRNIFNKMLKNTFKYLLYM